MAGMVGNSKAAAADAPAPAIDALAEAASFAAKVTSSPREQGVIARNLVMFPPETLVRGVFFEGLSRIITQSKGAAALAELQRAAGVSRQIVAFRHYPHRDFYRLYYLASRALHPSQPLPTALRLVGRTFFPIFRSSMLGKTMSAFMGNESRTILPLLAKAYSLSVSGNDHASELVDDHNLEWTCRVEGVEWYEETFAGIIEGTAPDGVSPTSLKVKTLAKSTDGAFTRYRFKITW
jgi:uncharacterized protein (TIGR02265 family)